MSAPRIPGSVGTPRRKIDPKSVRQRVLAHVLATLGPVTPSSVGKALGIATTVAGGHLKQFADQGKIEHPEYGVYQRPSAKPKRGGAS